MSRQGATLGVVLVLCALCAGLGYVVGRREAGPEPEGGQYLQRLREQLELRPDQVQRIDQLLTLHDLEVGRLVEARREELREPLAEHLDRTEAEILAVLDDAQRRRYDELNRD